MMITLKMFFHIFPVWYNNNGVHTLIILLDDKTKFKFIREQRPATRSHDHFMGS